MVNYKLLISAELENLTNLQPHGGCDDDDFTYLFKLKCENCGEVTSKETSVCLSDTVQVAKSKGSTVHLAQKCKFCGRDGTINMLPGHGKPLTNEASESGGFTTLMAFDCRGFEPIEYVFGPGWKVESLGGTKYEDVDLSSPEFTEYDEKDEVPVMVSNLRYKFEVFK